MSDMDFNANDLRPVTDSTPVEFFGGPNDGEFRSLCENSRRATGIYIVCNDDDDRVTGMRWVQDGDREPWEQDGAA